MNRSTFQGKEIKDTDKLVAQGIADGDTIEFCLRCCSGLVLHLLVGDWWHLIDWIIKAAATEED